MQSETDSTWRRARGKESHGWELLLLLSSLVAAILFGAAALRETLLAPWISYQQAYRSVLLERGRDERSRRAAETFQFRHRQLYLAGLGRTDRCPTCHIGIDDPGMKEAEQPLTAHPGDFLVSHPSDRFGCTICHGGQGRATEAREAHGQEVGRPAHMHRGEMLQVVCARCHTDASLPGVPVYNLARKLFSEKACLGCHSRNGTGGTRGPDLTAVADKHDVEWHVAHFLDPQKVVPGSQMPALDLSEEEARALAYLMMSFTDERFAREYIPTPRTIEGEGTKADLAIERLGAHLDPQAAEGYVGSETCLICHSGLHAEAMDGWRSSKMAQAFDVIRGATDIEQCLPCHTTGYNSQTNHFAEPHVTCEACHGPGKEYVPAALGGKISDHRARALGNVLQGNPCVRCHKPHVSKEKHEETMRRAAGAVQTAASAGEGPVAPDREPSREN